MQEISWSLVWGMWWVWRVPVWDQSLSLNELANCSSTVCDVWWIIRLSEVEGPVLLWGEVSSITVGGLAGTAGKVHGSKERFGKWDPMTMIWDYRRQRRSSFRKVKLTFLTSELPRLSLSVFFRGGGQGVEEDLRKQIPHTEDTDTEVLNNRFTK